MIDNYGIIIQLISSSEKELIRKELKKSYFICICDL